MAILKHISGILFLPILLTGCYEDFDPNIDLKPVLCINSIITAGEAVSVQVTHTWAYNNKEEREDHKVDDATVRIYANDAITEKDYIAQEGDEIRIVATSPTYGSAEATVKVPFAPTVPEILFEPKVKEAFRAEDKPMTESVSYDTRISMTIADNPQSDDFFKLDMAYQAPSCIFISSNGWIWNPNNFKYDDDDYDECFGILSTGELEYDAEPIFKEHIGSFDTVMGSEEGLYLMFSDRQFSGKSYNLTLMIEDADLEINSPEYDPNLYNCKLLLTLSSISRSYYDYAIYDWQTNSGAIGTLSEFGFADQIWAYSNVSTGAGVVAARAVTRCTVDLKDFLQAAMEKE